MIMWGIQWGLGIFLASWNFYGRKKKHSIYQASSALEKTAWRHFILQWSGVQREKWAWRSPHITPRQAGMWIQWHSQIDWRKPEPRVGSTHRPAQHKSQQTSSRRPWKAASLPSEARTYSQSTAFQKEMPTLERQGKWKLPWCTRGCKPPFGLPRVATANGRQSQTFRWWLDILGY